MPRVGLLMMIVCAYGCAVPLQAARDGARWSGRECGSVLYGLDELESPGEMPVVADPSVEGQVLLAVCARGQKTTYSGGTIVQVPRIATARVEDVYRGWDDTAPAPFTAVALAAAAIEVLDDAYPRRTDLGLAVLIATVVPPAVVERELAAVDVPGDARAAFTARYCDVAARLGGMLTTDEHLLWVELPAAVYRARADHMARFAPLYDRLAALRWDATAARDDAARLAPAIAGLAALRGELLTACGTIECRYQPLYAIATRELAQLYALQGDLLAARVESRLISVDGSDLGDLAQAVRSAQRTVVDGMTTAWSRYRAAIASGTDDRAARRLAGPMLPAADPAEVALIDVALAAPDASRAIDRSPNQVYSSNGIVEAIRGAGATRTLVFRPSTYELDADAYTCAEGDRLIRVEADGTLAYDRSCRWRTRTIGDGHDPITVPAREANAIRRGDLVVFMTHDDRSLVLEVKRGDDTTQIRGDSLPSAH